MFLRLSVSHSVHRGSTWAGKPPPQAGTPSWTGTPPWSGTPPGQVHPPPGRYTPLAGTPSRQVHIPWAGTPPGRYTPQAGTPPQSQWMLWDTVNKQTVRIPLECILVYHLFPHL